MSKNSITLNPQLDIFGVWNRLSCLFLVVLPLLGFLHYAALADEKIVLNEWRSATPEVYLLTWTAKTARTDEINTHLYIELSPCELVYQYHNDGYRASYEIEAVVYNEFGEFVRRRAINDDIRFSSEREIADYEWNRYYKLEFPLEDGYYRVELIVTDRNSGKMLIKESTFEVDLHHALDVEASDLVLARKDAIMVPGRSKSSSILPYPQRIFGLTCMDLFYYFELYAPDDSPEGIVRFSVHLIGPDNVLYSIASGDLSLKHQKVPYMGRVSTDTLAPGNYRLQVELHQPGSIYRLTREKSFTVFQSPVDLRFREFRAILNELRLIASDEEWRQLGELNQPDVTPVAQQAAVDAFWKRRDPTPETPRNELMAEFYHRAATAEVLFDESRGLNRLTDRSKVLMLLGQPKSIQRQHDGSLMGYVEIWHYPGHKFQVIFRDVHGFGDYQLVTPDHLLIGLNE